MGSTKPLDAFTFLFEETQWGPFIAHAYQYEPGASTWVFETDPETFRRAGLDRMDEAQSARLMEEIFGWFLQGHKIKTNRSLWRNFPMIRNARWVRGNLVLLGDAKSSAHFSIGSGTKLAMEDAIALYEALHAERSIDAALARFETARREEVEKTQHAADVSLVWFEHVDRFWDFDPVQFAFGVMTRAKAITYDNLRLRAPAFVDEVDRHFARQVAARGFDVDVDKPAVPMFQPLRLRDMVLPNRVVMSPMDMYSAVDGVPQDWHLVHYGARAIGGAALMFTEMTCPSPEARITLGCTGLWNDEQERAWAKIVDFVHANSAAKFCLQLGHSGRKGATKLMWEGMDRPLDEGAWDVCSASPSRTSRTARCRANWTAPAWTASSPSSSPRPSAASAPASTCSSCTAPTAICFASFISPLTNRRSDEYGGTLENRLRFPLERVHGDARSLAGAQADVGAHLGDRLGGGRAHRRRGGRWSRAPSPRRASTSSTSRPGRRSPRRGRSTGACTRRRSRTRSATRRMSRRWRRRHHDAGPGQHDSRGRPRRPRRPRAPAPRRPVLHHEGGGLVRRASIHCPPQYQPGKDQIFRNSVRDRADLEDLRIRGKPKTRAELKAEREAERKLAAE